uniref:Uncharacterized protein n=1 Tax=Anguilla anguilla TaxID=7936 RepID=A0A0E9W6T1_ANGAN
MSGYVFCLCDLQLLLTTKKNCNDVHSCI